MDDLFQIPLWMMWKHAYPKNEEDKIRHGVSDAVLDHAAEEMSRIDPEKNMVVESKHVENGSGR